MQYLDNKFSPYDFQLFAPRRRDLRKPISVAASEDMKKCTSFPKGFSEGYTAALQLGRLKYCITQCAVHSSLGLSQAACVSDDCEDKLSESLTLLSHG